MWAASIPNFVSLGGLWHTVKSGIFDVLEKKQLLPTRLAAAQVCVTPGRVPCVRNVAVFVLGIDVLRVPDSTAFLYSCVHKCTLNEAPLMYHPLLFLSRGRTSPCPMLRMSVGLR